MTDAEIHIRYLTAMALAREAGWLALGYYENQARLGVTMKGFQDFLTEADGAVEAMLRSTLAKVFPSDGFLGEEGGGTGADHLWIVDPIDGTANFARAEPHWCISIGFVVNGVSQLGVIFCPVTGEMFHARRGAGAFLNGKSIKVSPTADMKTAAVEIGWSPRRPSSEYLEIVTKVLGLGSTAKRSASGALGMAYVACGRTDGYLELHINSWDVAAGIVIVTEAGGTVNDFFAGDGIERGNPIMASTPALSGQLSKVLCLKN